MSLGEPLVACFLVLGPVSQATHFRLKENHLLTALPPETNKDSYGSLKCSDHPREMSRKGEKQKRERNRYKGNKAEQEWFEWEGRHQMCPHGGKEAMERNHHSKIQYQKKGKAMVQISFREIHESTKQSSPKF